MLDTVLLHAKRWALRIDATLAALSVLPVMHDVIGLCLDVCGVSGAINGVDVWRTGGAGILIAVPFSLSILCVVVLSFTPFQVEKLTVAADCLQMGVCNFMTFWKAPYVLTVPLDGILSATFIHVGLLRSAFVAVRVSGAGRAYLLQVSSQCATEKQIDKLQELLGYRFRQEKVLLLSPALWPVWLSAVGSVMAVLIFYMLVAIFHALS
jgi:hypothetical protein